MSVFSVYSNPAISPKNALWAVPTPFTWAAPHPAAVNLPGTVYATQ